MLGTLLLTLAMPATPLSAATMLVQDNPPVQVWLNKKDYVEFGDRVKVFVRSEYDGHLIVLHADPEGRVRVLYPVDPFVDDFIRGGRTFEIEGRQNGHSFRAVDTPGIGTVFVAYSEDPFNYEQFVVNGHWDFRALQGVDVVGNAEGELVALVQDMAQGSYFDYDTEDYYVETPVNYRARYRSLYGFDPYWDDPYYYSSAFGYRGGISIGLYFGSPRYRYRRWGWYGWDPYWAHYDPFYYDPWYYSSWYGPRYYYPRTVYVVAGTRRNYASVGHKYTFKDRGGQPYRVGMRQRTVGGTTIAGNASTLRRPQARRVGSTAVRRGSPVNTAASTTRRAAPSQRNAATNRRVTPSQRNASTVRRTPTQSVNGARRAASPTRRTTSETVRRTSPTRVQPGGKIGDRRTPAFRSRSTTPRPSDAVRSPRRSPDIGSPNRTSSTRRTPTATRSNTARPASRGSVTPQSTRRSPSVRPSTSRSRTRTASPATRSAPRSSARPASRPVQRSVTPSRSNRTRSVTRPSTSSRTVRRTTSRTSSRPVTRSTRAPTRSVSRPATRPNRPAARSAPARTNSRPAVRPSSSRSRPAVRPATRSSSGSSARRPTRRRN